MIVTTTGDVDGQNIDGYLGIVSGRAMTRVGIVRGLFSEVRDRVGARIVSGSYVSDRPDPYQAEFDQARENAMDDLQRAAAAMGADAVIGVDLEYRTAAGGAMVLVTASGTAVRLRQAA
jgi:uncharacterized protein YbjQ (UPF0145 family)